MRILFWSYDCAGELRFGNRCIISKSDVQQCDPQGQLLFSLVVELLDEIKNLISNLQALKNLVSRQWNIY